MRETPKAAQAFEQYYDLGDDRSLEALAKRTHQEALAMKTLNQDGTEHVPTVIGILSQLKKWSAAHRWQERIITREKEEGERARKKKAKRIDAMNERHMLIGTTQQARAIKQIEQLIEVKRFGSQAAVQLLKMATDLERLAIGAPTERTEQTGLDGAPLIPVHIYIPDNGRDGYGKQEDDTG